MQRINPAVFQNGVAVMRNVELVTSWLERAAAREGGDPARECLRLCRAADGKPYYKTAGGEFYRAYCYIANAYTVKAPATLRETGSAAAAYGKFIRRLSDLEHERLEITIPGFHGLEKRIKALERAAREDALGRAGGAAREIEYAQRHAAPHGLIENAVEQGAARLFAVHGDTKLSNVLFDGASKEAICVIDLDTVMPGTPLFDFGDFVRSGASPAGEDAKGRLDLSLFSAAAAGFMSEAGRCLNAQERELLAFAPSEAAFELGVRFLTDYLEGDGYFKTAYSGQNLKRAAAMFDLSAQFDGALERMRREVKNL